MFFWMMCICIAVPLHRPSRNKSSQNHCYVLQTQVNWRGQYVLFYLPVFLCEYPAFGKWTKFNLSFVWSRTYIEVLGTRLNPLDKCYQYRVSSESGQEFRRWNLWSRRCSRPLLCVHFMNFVQQIHNISSYAGGPLFLQLVIWLQMVG
jgi:hypothetical protein